MDSNPPNQRDAVKLFARLGYASRGVVYLLVGGLAALAALAKAAKPKAAAARLKAY